MRTADGNSFSRGENKLAVFDADYIREVDDKTFMAFDEIPVKFIFDFFKSWNNGQTFIAEMNGHFVAVTLNESYAF